MNDYDTIVSISTSIGESAINIIRLSGQDSIKIAMKILKGVDLFKKEANTISYAHVYDNDKKIDEVLVSLFKAPKSYTAEDIVEINTHGGSFVTGVVLDLLLKNGARLAEAGEFTKRAFLNGRIDLSKAEAVMDLIRAKTNKSLSLANREMNGEVYFLVSSLRKSIEDMLLHISVNIDYPEYTDEIKITRDMVLSASKKLIDEIESILEKAETMRIYKEGIKTVIVGKPNVGKSTLLNALLKEEKAIVTSVSGTTRDIVEGEINIGGVVLKLYDTAGIRETDDIVEKIGIEKTKKAIKEAELVILVLEHGSETTSEELNLIKETEGRKRIIVANKSDISKIQIGDFEYIDISAEKKEGIDLIEKKIKELFVKEEYLNTTEKLISSSRHIELMNKTKKSLKSAYEVASSGGFLDMIAIDLKEAYDDLGLITGETKSDGLIDELFKKFCLGK